MQKQRHALTEDPETNPDAPQQAVALKYDTEKDRAPKVAAKGRGYVAENILAAARQNDPAAAEEITRRVMLDSIHFWQISAQPTK